MAHTFRYRGVLARRVLTIAGVATASLIAAYAAGCGGIVVVDGEQRHGAGGAGGDSTTGSSPSGGSCEPTSVTGGPGGETLRQMTKCFEWTAGALCPVKEVGAGLVVATPCGSIRSVDCGPIQDGATCCYVVTETVEGCPD